MPVDASCRGRSALTAAFVRTVKEPGKYHDRRGTGLFLLVRPNGSRFWVQRITIRGKRREMGLGSPPVVRLVEAREQALSNKRIARAGGDPLAEKLRFRSELTFEDAARKAHEEISPSLKNPKDRTAYLNSLEKYIFPEFGAIALRDVTSADVRRAILAARAQAPMVARKLIYRTSAVFRWGIAEGLCENNPSTSEALALPRLNREAKHRKALPYLEVQSCITDIWKSGAGLSTKLAIEFLILTAKRSGEVREARWEEIQLEGGTTLGAATHATWIIPANRIKMKREHREPLSRRALEILRQAQALDNKSGYVFPGTKHGRPLSDMTLSKLVKELGYNADIHGFRTSFRTWAQERTSFSREVAEAALAHKVGDSVEQAYARSDVLEKRRKLMEDWSVYLQDEPEVAIAKSR